MRSKIGGILERWEEIAGEQPGQDTTQEAEKARNSKSNQEFGSKLYYSATIWWVVVGDGSLYSDRSM